MHSVSSHQMFTLDAFVPGFSMAATAAEQLLSGDLSLYAYLACVFGVVGFLSDYISRLVWWLRPSLTSTIHIPRSDEVYDMLLLWVSTHQIGDTARSCMAQVTKKRESGEQNFHGAKKRLNYVPWEGGFWFWYQHYPISFRTELHDIGFHKEERISLTCLGRSSKVLKELLNECREEYLVKIQDKTTIFENRENRWKRMASRDIRPSSTVFLPEQKKQHLLNDIKEFLGPEDKIWYSRKSLPYRRGYLLSGPPGTGKSSLSLSIAGEFELDLYVVSISNTTDASLKDLFGELPEKCAVLLEDIDAAGVSHSRESDSEDSDDDRGTSQRKAGVTMSGLLNTLDGVASQEGRIVLMTTNHVEKLDEALIRPGRVDMIIDFELTDKDVIARLFCFILGDLNEGANEQHEKNTIIDKQAAAFASKVPQLKFSQAEIISYLLRHRGLPGRAVENCEVWVESLLEKKKSASRRQFTGSSGAASPKV